MSGILLTKYDTFFLGEIASILGFLMNSIFNFLEMLTISNVGISIILFTIVIYMFMTPLTVKQQKFSKLQSKMSPELQSISLKYKGKKDNDSMMKQQQETQAVYGKYGVSPMGSCLPMLIQFPILITLYRVINSMPAYVNTIKEAFFPLVDNLISEAGSLELLQSFKNSMMFNNQIENELFTSGSTEYVQNTYIDMLNKASSAEWASISSAFPNLTSDVTETVANLNEYNSFIGLNISNSPTYIIQEAFASGSYLLVLGALLIPFLAWFSQWFSLKLMPQAAQQANGPENQMASTMKTMNTIMPIMSAFFCLTLPVGMGIYWIASAVIRSIQSIFINKHMDKVDLDELIKKNVEKKNKKRAKQGLPPQQISSNARISTKSVAKPVVVKSSEEKLDTINKSTDYYKSNAKPGSLSSKAGMVKQYNEKNNK